MPHAPATPSAKSTPPGPGAILLVVVRTIELFTDRFPGRPAYDTAVSHALLREVGERVRGETLRAHRADDWVAFSVLDTRLAGFERAVEAARAHGFGAALRLAGGHAAAFHTESLAFGWAMPIDDPRRGIQARFDAVAELIARALRRLGVDARVGEVEGEYCPGQHSVNAGGTRKLMGVGQRVIQGAAHVGGVVVVREAARIRDVLEPVYRALDLPMRPETVGCVADEAPGVTVEDVRAAILAEAEREAAVRPADLDVRVLERADELADWHAPRRRGGAAVPGPAKVAVGRPAGSR